VKVAVAGHIEQGKLQISPSSRHILQESLLVWTDGPVNITVERRHATRSVQANAYYWGVVIKALSEYTGSTPDEIHQVLKMMFLPKDLAIASPNGEVIGEFVIGGSTTRLNTVDFYEYVETIRVWAFEKLDVDIAPPDPEWREHVLEVRGAEQNEGAA